MLTEAYFRVFKWGFEIILRCFDAENCVAGYGGGGDSHTDLFYWTIVEFSSISTFVL